MPFPKPLAEFTHPFCEGNPHAQLLKALAAVSDASPVAGPSSAGGSGNNTIALCNPCGIRILLWNLQDLGGGPSRGPERPGWVIDRIASIISECDPDVIVILEVKKLGRQPRAPAEPVISDRQTRSSKGREAEAAAELFQRLMEDYQKRLAAYEKARALYVEAQKSGESTGLRQLAAILDRLNSKGGGPWKPVDYTGDVFTNGESYGFLVRAGLFPSAECRMLPDLPGRTMSSLSAPSLMKST